METLDWFSHKIFWNTLASHLMLQEKEGQLIMTFKSGGHKFHLEQAAEHNQFSIARNSFRKGCLQQTFDE